MTATNPKSQLNKTRIHIDDGLVALVDILAEIDTNSPMAKLNATTIADNNGGRIVL